MPEATFTFTAIKYAPMHSLLKLPCMLLFTAAALFSGLLPAQVKYGTVNYTASPSFTVSSTGEELPGGDKIEKMLRDLHAGGGFDKQYSLTFTPDAFVFRERDEKDQTVEEGDLTVTILRNQTDPEIFYTDTETDTYTNQEAIADQLFLHDGSVPPLAWTLQDATLPASDATLGFDLRTATAVTESGDTLTAAYAPALAVPFGPLNYYGLPGAILQLDVCRVGKCTRYRAVSMEVRSERPDLELPRKGKKVNRQSFLRARDKYRSRRARTSIQTFQN